MSNNAIIMVSIGNRPWASTAIQNVKDYCKRILCDFVLEDKLDPVLVAALKSVERNKKGRKNKAAYATKALIVNKHLETYNRICVIDDSCLITKNASDVFSIVPEDSIGINKERCKTEKEFDDISGTVFDKIKRFQKSTNEPLINFDKTVYMNSGFMVYSRIHKSAFSFDNIVKSKELLLSFYPHQTLAFYLIQKHNYKTFALGSEWHNVPALGSKEFWHRSERQHLTDPRPFIKETDCLIHYTGTYKHRESLIKKTNQIVSITSSKS